MNYQPCGMPRCTNHFLIKNTLDAAGVRFFSYLHKRAVLKGIRHNMGMSEIRPLRIERHFRNPLTPA
jgi:hypothetical protein